MSSVYQKNTYTQAVPLLILELYTRLGRFATSALSSSPPSPVAAGFRPWYTIAHSGLKSEQKILKKNLRFKKIQFFKIQKIQKSPNYSKLWLQYFQMQPLKIILVFYQVCMYYVSRWYRNSWQLGRRRAGQLRFGFVAVLVGHIVCIIFRSIRQIQSIYYLKDWTFWRWLNPDHCGLCFYIQNRGSGGRRK
jgi:hypothetical protein